MPTCLFRKYSSICHFFTMCKKIRGKSWNKSTSSTMAYLCSHFLLVITSVSSQVLCIRPRHSWPTATPERPWPPQTTNTSPQALLHTLTNWKSALSLSLVWSQADHENATIHCKLHMEGGEVHNKMRNNIIFGNYSPWRASLCKHIQYDRFL